MNEHATMGMTPYEQFMMSEKTSRHRAGGTAITGLVLGCVGTALGIGAWVFAPIYANARAKAAEAQNAGTAALLQQTAALLANERAERVAQGTTISQTITDTISGQQSSTLTAQQAAELSSIQSVQQNLLNQAIMGNLSENPQKVQLYSAPQPCACPGCGCNG